MPTFEKLFKKSTDAVVTNFAYTKFVAYGLSIDTEANMKCQFCGKNIDEVDNTCKMCTICGWALDAIVQDTPQAKVDEKTISAPPEAQK